MIAEPRKSRRNIEEWRNSKLKLVQIPTSPQILTDDDFNESI